MRTKYTFLNPRTNKEIIVESDRGYWAAFDQACEWEHTRNITLKHAENEKEVIQ